MPLVKAGSLLQNAQAGEYAVGAFNVENLEMAQGVVAAAERMGAPVIVQTTPGTLRYAPPEAFAGMVRALAEAAVVPVALHLDHGHAFELAERAVAAGYTSIMIDGSTLPYEQNLALTRRVVSMATGLPVEAELGTVGGKEDDHAAQVQYTDPAMARDFARDTGIASFAVAIGTAHGVYKGEPKLDLDRLSAIREAVAVPLVLHGTSGVPAAQVRACIRRGICKVNYATELRIVFSQAVRRALAAAPEALDPKAYLGPAREAVTELVCQRIKLCGCDGKA
jgi:tagatose 1,6-diphosphate aldolase GatY/KbaY